MLNNRKILITGGTGSFGNAVLSKFLDSDIDEIRIFSRDEKKQHDMRVALNHPKVSFYIGDARDYKSLDLALKGLDYVFQAALLKRCLHVIFQWMILEHVVLGSKISL